MAGCGDKTNSFDTSRWVAEKGNFDRASARDDLMPAAVKQLRVGMTRDEVLRLFGEPDSRDEDTFSYYLGRDRLGMHFSAWDVHFDAQGRVHSHQRRRVA